MNRNPTQKVRHHQTVCGIFLTLALLCLCGCAAFPLDVGATYSARPHWSLRACLVHPWILDVRSGEPGDARVVGWMGGKRVAGAPLAACRRDGAGFR